MFFAQTNNMSPAAMQVDNPEVGKRFEGLSEGAKSYVLNAYMKHKYPRVV